MDYELDALRAEVLRKRLGGPANGNLVFWRDKDVARIREHVSKMDRAQLGRAARALATTPPAKPAAVQTAAQRVREARQLTAAVRRLCAAPLSRAERVAEAKEFARIAARAARL